MIKRKTLHSMNKSEEMFRSFIIAAILFKTIIRTAMYWKMGIFKMLFKLLRAIYLIQEFDLNVIVIMILWLMQ